MDAGPDLDSHRRPTGRAWLDVVLGISAVAISLTSLLLAIGNGDAMKRLVQANSWPFVSVGFSNGDETGDRFLRFEAKNNGIGPAKVQTLEVFYNGKPMSDPRMLILAILGPAANGVRIPYRDSALVGEVLSPRELKYILTVSDKHIGPANLERLSSEARNVGIRTCYCSVFDECWIFDGASRISPPRSVKVCPVPKIPFEL
jgi:hypothetical protein